MPISIRVAGTELVTNELIGLTPKLERTVLARMSQIAFDEAQRGAGTHSKKGDLFASLYNRKTATGGREVGHDPQRAPHALWVNFGTRPHKIKGKPLPTPYRVYPKDPNGVLAFKVRGIFRRWYLKRQKTLRWVVGNRFVFANSIQHPGYRGDAYIIRAADDAIRQFNAIVNEAFNDAQKP